MSEPLLFWWVAGRYPDGEPQESRRDGAEAMTLCHCGRPRAAKAIQCERCRMEEICFAPPVEEIYRIARALRNGEIVLLGMRKASLRPRGGMVMSDDEERAWRRSQVTEEVDDEP